MEEYEAEGETRGDRRQSGFQVRAGAEGFKRHREAGGGSHKINLL